MIDFRLVRHLHAFLVVAEEGHFGRAAARLGISQPPLTQQIQVLEVSLGVRLLERSRRGTQLTAHGAAIFPIVRRFVDQAERIELMVREAKDGKASELRIGTILSGMTDVIPSRVAQLRKLFPNLSLSIIEIDSYQALPMVESGELDVAFGRITRSFGDLSIRQVAKDHLVLAVPDGHHLLSSDEVDLKDLRDEPLILFSRRTAPEYFDNIIALCVSAGLSPRIMHECRTVATQIAMVGCGLGLALVPSASATVTPNVHFRRISQQQEIATISAVWHAKRPNPFLDALIDMVGSHGKV